MWNPFKKNEEEAEMSKYQNEEDVKFQLPAPQAFDPSILETVEEGYATNEGQGETAVEMREESLADDSLAEDSLTQKLKKTIRGLLLALVVLMPVFFLPFTAPSDTLAINKQILLYGITFTSFIFWMVIMVRGGGAKFRLSGFEIGVSVFLAAGLLSAIFSAQVYQSFMAGGGFLVWASLAVFWFLAVNFFDKRDAGKLLNWFLLGSFIAVLLGLTTLFGVPFLTNFINQTNTIGSFSALGVLAALSLITVAAGYFGVFSHRSAESRFWSVVRAVSAAACALLIVMLNWWILYVVLAAAMLLFVLWPAIANRLGLNVKLKAFGLIGPLAILVLSLMLLVGGRYFGFQVAGRQNLPVEVSVSFKGSAEIVKGVLETKPIFGLGQENFSIAFDKFKPRGINQSVFWNVRFNDAGSELFNLAVEWGATGLAAFIFLIFSVFRLVSRKKIWLDGENGFTAVVVALFISALLFFGLYQFNITLLFAFWFFLALVAVLTAEEDKKITVRMDDASFSSIFSSLAFVLVLVFGLIGGYMVWQKYQGETYFAGVARTALDKPAEVDKAVDTLIKTVNVNRNEDRYLNSLAQLLLTRIGNNLRDKTGKQEDIAARIQKDVNAVTQIAARLTVAHPNNAANWSNAGFIYENLVSFVEGADNAALTAYKGYVERAPFDPSTQVRMGNIYFSRAERNGVLLANARSRQQAVANEKEIAAAVSGDYKNAEESFKKAVALKSDLAGALYNLGVVYEREAKIKDAVKQLELTKLVNPNDPGLAFELGLLYSRDNQKDKALSEMARAVNLFKDYSNARWYLALMFEEKEQIDLAVSQLEEILKLDVNKDNQVVKDKLKALKEGKREIPPSKVTSKKPLEEAGR